MNKVNKKFFTALIAGALSISLTGTAFAWGSWGGSGSSGGTGSPGGGYSQSSNQGGGYDRQKGNHQQGMNSGWDNGGQDKKGTSLNNNWAGGKEGKSRHGFSDMKEASWAEPYVLKMQGKDVVKGYPDGSFKPNQKMTRAEAVTMMARSQGAPQGAGQTAYADAPDWAACYINWAVDKKVLTPGQDNNQLQPDRPATRIWVAQMAVRALGLEDQARALKDTSLPFKDAPAIPAGMAGYVKIAYDKGIFAGYPDYTFQPNNPISRAEMCIIMSCLNAVMNNEVLGTITTVDAGSLTVAGSVYGSGSSSIAIAPNATVWINNTPATVNDLKPGDVVEVDLNAQGQAVIIDATRSQTGTSAAPATVTGSNTSAGASTNASASNNTSTNSSNNTNANNSTSAGAGTSQSPPAQ